MGASWSFGLSHAISFRLSENPSNSRGDQSPNSTRQLKTALSSAPCWGRCFWAQSQLLIGMHQKSQFFSSEGMKLALLTRLRCHWPRVHCLLDRPFLKSPRTLCPRESLPAFGLGEPF